MEYLEKLAQFELYSNRIICFYCNYINWWFASLLIITAPFYLMCGYKKEEEINWKDYGKTWAVTREELENGSN